MMKGILVGLTVLAVSTSAALAAHHKHPMKPKAAAAATNPSPGGATPVIWPGGVSAEDRALYAKNLRDSGMKK
jgi:hypothetical protein